jgi:hypothetical protein
MRRSFQLKTEREEDAAFRWRKKAKGNPRARGCSAHEEATVMRTTAWILGFALLGSVTGCGPDDSSDGANGASSGTGGTAPRGGSSGTGGDAARGGSSGTGGGSSARPSGVTVFSVGYTSLDGVDTGSHEVVLHTTVTTFDAGVLDMDATKDKVWLTREKGSVAVVDRGSQKKLADVDLLAVAGNPEGIVELPVLTADDDAAYTVLEVGGTMSVMRIDGDTFDVKAASDVLDPVGFATGLRVDGQDLWALTGNSFELIKLDPATLERRDAVWLGAPPDDAKGFGENYFGDGELAVSPNAVFVLDVAALRLIRVNKATLEPNVADDLSDLDLDGWPSFFSRGGDVYIEGNKSVYRFDGTTGARLESYDRTAQGGFATFDVLGDTLYLNPADYSRHEVLEFDANTGKLLQSIPSPSENIGAAIVR